MTTTTTTATLVSLSLNEIWLVDMLIKGADGAGRGVISSANWPGPPQQLGGLMTSLNKKGVVSYAVRNGTTYYAVSADFLARNPRGVDVREFTF